MPIDNAKSFLMQLLCFIRSGILWDIFVNMKEGYARRYKMGFGAVLLASKLAKTNVLKVLLNNRAGKIFFKPFQRQ